MLDFTWGDDAFPLRFTAADDGPVLASVTVGVDAVEPQRPEQRARPALVEVLAVGEGRGLGSMRAIRTAIGDRLRHVEHREEAVDGRSALVLVQQDERTGLVVTTRIERFDGLAAYRVSSALENRGAVPLLLQQVTSGTFIGLTGHLGALEDVDLRTARSEWCAENRWSSTALTGTAGLADIDAALHGHFARGSIALTGRSTWPSGEWVPVAALEHRGTGRSLAWEVEHNGPWRWELDTLFDPAEALALALLGPTDVDHAWLHRLEPGATFTTVPASVALADGGFAGAIAQLTEHRRRSHLDVHADSARPLVFNDYMNALMGDPTTEQLLPLIDAAASVGAEVFCIDAGWYDDGGDWWPSVGAWEPSTIRFGERGLPGVLQVIRDRGMTPGLWVEPEVVGVRSPVARTLPEDAFMHRAGVRIVEHDRYFLDLRNPAARAHLDAVFDRLIDAYGARYFKWDYNVTPGSGPDADAASPGDGLLGHARALLTWVEGLRARHPGIVLEACSSGAQRMDTATLARFDLQSTTDQQDARRYPAIAAAAPAAMPPETAGNWAYPQSEWSDERIAFTLVTGLSGRLYLSGNLDRLDERQLALVREATAAYPDVIRHHARALPSWPLGLPAWDAPQVALATTSADETLAFVWNREEDATAVDLAFPALRGREVRVETVFPRALPAWPTSWDAAAGVLTVDLTGAGEGARVLRLR